MGHDGDLMAARLDVEEIREHIGADSLAFLSLDGMMRAIGNGDGGDDGLLQRLLHRPLPARGRRGAGQAELRGRPGVMRVAVIGGGGREQAIAWACRRHGHDVTIAPTSSTTSTAADSTSSSPARRRRSSPASPTSAPRRGVPCFGPTAELARLESSKGYARRAGRRRSASPARASPASTPATPTARGVVATSSARPVVVKLDGLAAGKGVIVPADRAETRGRDPHARRRGPIVLEERLTGPECSLLALCDGTHRASPLPLAQDHKRIGEGDTGPNTGGMGAYAPAPVPLRRRRARWRRSSSRCSTTSPPPARRTSACSTPG